MDDIIQRVVSRILCGGEVCFRGYSFIKINQMKKILLANIGNRNLYVEDTNGYFTTIDRYVSDKRLMQYIEITVYQLPSRLL